MKRKKIYVVVVNGKPAVGKTTFQEMVKDRPYGMCVHIKSSVDKIYEVYKQLGWDGNKDNEFRMNMHLLKQMYIKNCDGPLNDLIDYIIGLVSYDTSRCGHIVFYDCREADEIKKTVDTMKGLGCIGVRVKTMYIDAGDKSASTYGNPSDDMATQDSYKYDIVISNTGNIEELRDIAGQFVSSIKEEIKNENQ